MAAPRFGADRVSDAVTPARSRSSRRVRLWLPVVLSTVVQVPSALVTGFGPRGTREPELREDWGATLPLALIGPIALVAARRYPGPVVAVVAAAAVGDLLLRTGAIGPPYIALAFAIVGAIVRGARPWAWASAVGVWAGTLALLLLPGAETAPGRAAFTTFGVLGMLGIGEAARARRERMAEYRRSDAQRRQTAAEAERVRIARELHDVLAHSLSSINVQAGVGLHLIERDPASAAQSLAAIKATSKTALDEVRSVLGILRADDGSATSPLMPEPDLSQLDRLAASVTAQGLVVELVVAPEVSAAEVPRSLQLALYRIVQESLTNVLRHAHASRVVVAVRTDGGDYVVEVVDDGRGNGGTGADGGEEGRRGLLGMRERAELLGGTLEAGTVPGGGFRVIARIPDPRREQS